MALAVVKSLSVWLLTPAQSPIDSISQNGEVKGWRYAVVDTSAFTPKKIHTKIRIFANLLFEFLIKKNNVVLVHQLVEAQLESGFDSTLY